MSQICNLRRIGEGTGKVEGRELNFGDSDTPVVRPVFKDGPLAGSADGTFVGTVGTIVK